MLGNDMIGCQSVSDAMALMETFEEAARLYSPRAKAGEGVLEVSRDEGLVGVYEGPYQPRRWVRVIALPVSVDLELIKDEARQARDKIDRFYAENKLIGKRVIASVGRCDITKNTVNLVEEWARALDAKPELAMSSALLVVSPTTRNGVKGYHEELVRLENAVAAVKARHGAECIVHVDKDGWPHDMVMANYAREEVIASVLASDYEGMGLPGHELFTAKEGRGEACYIVSRLPGSYHFFPHNCVTALSDPKQPGVIRDAYLRVLAMSREELRKSCAAGYARVSGWTARDWNERGLDAIATSAAHRFSPVRGVTVEDFMFN
jgi:trehalose-6-phosphate synthase